MKFLIGQTIAVIAIHLCVFPTPLPACSVPVFRYALERWPADDYEVVIAYRGQLDTDAKALLDYLENHSGANLNVQTEELDDTQDSQLLTRWQEVGAEAMPWMLVRYPEKARLIGEAWSAPLTRHSVEQLVDSSARRELATRLLAGDTAVFVFLEIGDTSKDQPALKLLQSELAKLQQQITLPEILQADIDQGLLAADPEDLKIAFSTIRVSRDDAAEAALVATLLGTEYDLREFDEPMVFPVFGRGRVLYALVGPGINPDTIAQACDDVTGPCTCTVKEQNPGIDLLMAVDWDRSVQSGILDKVPPPLAGVGEFTDPPSDPADSDSAIVEFDVAVSRSRLFTGTLVIVAVAGLITLAGVTLLILRRGA